MREVCSEEKVSSLAVVFPVDEVSEDAEGKDIGEELEVPLDEEEAEATQTLPTPDTPTRSEVLDHRVCHYPYRTWCKHCVEGRGQEFGHHSHKGEPRGTPTVSFDYCYVGDRGDIVSQEEF